MGDFLITKYLSSCGGQKSRFIESKVEVDSRI